ncbi:MAG TPA: TIGR03000 domain-containing protein [Gemmataceae bacterium]|nr:TIGR03000 domain-containing protein [Gemmataceae bacterium]
MYSLVMMAALTAGPDVPQHWMCPVTPSNYGCGFWSNHCFYECCAPARYGWVNCWNKGFSYYPGGGRGFCGDCTATYGTFYYPPTCSCAPCGGTSAAPGGNFDHNWCGYGWPIGDQPAYYTSVIGCPPHVIAPPYAYYTERDPCCRYGQFAFDSGLIGHSQGIGYAGFSGYGNFGFYGGVPMTHPATTADLPPFPRPDLRTPSALPTKPAPMPPIPGGPTPPGEEKKEEKKGEPKKDNEKRAELAPAKVALSVPAGAHVTVDGYFLSGTGRERTFITPALEPGERYEYTVRASLTIDGREEVESLNVTVEAGEISRASFEKLFALIERPSGRTLANAPGR